MSDNVEEKRSWLERLSDLLIREPKDREQLMSVLRDAEDRDILSAETLSMIESVLQLSEMQVKEVMIPKSDMIVLTQNSSLETILPITIESAHSRFPVIDKLGNDVIGIVLAKDLLKYGFHKSKTEFNMNDIIRPAVFVPQTKRLDILLREFRINRNHMAIVIDQYGHVAGLVTIEDVLEQIVGDIEDEYDINEEDDIRKFDDGSYTIKAATTIKDFNDYFKTHYDEKFETIGNLVMNDFDHLPRRGELLSIDNLQFKVLHSDNRKIHLLEVTEV
jgi:magnesium and cobalt transporter